MPTDEKEIRVQVYTGSTKTREWFDSLEDAVEWITCNYGEPTGERFNQSFSVGFNHRGGVETTVVMQRLFNEYQSAGGR